MYEAKYHLAASLTPIFWRSTENFACFAIVYELSQGLLILWTPVRKLIGLRNDAAAFRMTGRQLRLLLFARHIYHFHTIYTWSQQIAA